MQDTAARYAPYVLSIVRIVAALLFFEHGTSRLSAGRRRCRPPRCFRCTGSPA